MTLRRTPIRLLVSLSAAVVFISLQAAAARGQSARELAEAGHWKRVRAIAEPRVKANPGDAEAQWLLSRTRDAFGDRDGALAPAERAVALEARNPSYHLQLASVCGSLAQNASIFRQLPLGSRMKRELQAALDLDPRNVDAIDARIEFLWMAPGFFGGDRKKAQQVAEQIGALDPVRGYLAQARLANRGNQPARAEAMYRKAMEADPRGYAAKAGLANVLSLGAAFGGGEAERLAREAIALAPDRVNAYSVLARVLARQQRLADLEVLLAQAERAVPDNLAPFLNAAIALLQDGRELPRGEAYLRKYLAQEVEGKSPSHGVARWRLGLVLEKQGRRQEALVELEIAARLEPKRDEISRDAKRVRGGRAWPQEAP